MFHTSMSFIHFLKKISQVLCKALQIMKCAAQVKLPSLCLVGGTEAVRGNPDEHWGNREPPHSRP